MTWHFESDRTVCWWCVLSLALLLVMVPGLATGQVDPPADVTATVESATAEEAQAPRDPLDLLLDRLTSSEGNGTVIGALDELSGMGQAEVARFFPVLVDLSLDANPEIAFRARLILVRVPSAELVSAYRSIAGDQSESMGRRVTSIRLLADLPEAEAIEALIDLAGEETLLRVRTEALRRLRDLLRFEIDGELTLEAVQAWWDEQRETDRQSGHQDSRRWLLAHDRQGSIDLEVAENRLIQMARRVYRLLEGEDRAHQLVSYLTDLDPALKQLGIDLVVARLEERETVSAPMRSALRRLMVSDQPELRERSVAVLLGLDDDAAADQVAERLVAGGEADPLVQTAMIRMLARKPRAEAAGVLTRWLGTDDYGTASAEALVALASEGALSDDARQQVRARLLERFSEPRPELSEEKQLLLRVVTAEDEAVVLSLLHDEVDTVRKQAVRTWLRFPSWNIDPLLDLASGDATGKLVCDGLVEHSDPTRVADAILAKPEPSPVLLGVLKALSSRLGDGDLIELDDAMVTWGRSRGERVALLLAATAEREEGLIESRIRAAELLLAEGRPADAVAVLEPLIGSDLDSDHALLVGVLASGRAEQTEAVGRFAQALVEAGRAESRISLLEVAEQLVGEFLATNKADQASAIWGQLRASLGDAQGEHELERYERLAGMIAPSAPEDAVGEEVEQSERVEGGEASNDEAEKEAGA